MQHYLILSSRHYLKEWLDDGHYLDNGPLLTITENETEIITEMESKF